MLYFFHLYNDMDVPDEEGKELPDLRAAREWALSQARGLVGELTKQDGRIVLHHRIDIADKDGRVLDSVRFGDAVDVEY